MSDQVVSVDLNQRDLWLLIGPLEDAIKALMEPDERVGVQDPDQERELQELRDLLDRLHLAQAELGRRVPPD